MWVSAGGLVGSDGGRTYPDAQKTAGKRADVHGDIGADLEKSNCLTFVNKQKQTGGKTSVRKRNVFTVP